MVVKTEISHLHYPPISDLGAPASGLYRERARLCFSPDVIRDICDFRATAELDAERIFG
jgi:hypothetical protein